MDLFIPHRQATISIFSPREDRKRSLREGANRLILIKEEEEKEGKKRPKHESINKISKKGGRNK